ncbi:MAG: GerMN domain-containing protein, partial [Clostridia bacterium]|nr:GerMN domain-containing protein [Clostridia bacterium]
MKTGICLITLLVLCLMVFPDVDLRQVSALPEASLSPATGPETDAEDGELKDAVLYFRFGETSLLGAARTQIDLRQEETVATTIVRRLIEGPGIHYDRLHGLFPEGTRLISAVSDGSTVFVTLNQAFLGRPDGAPLNWEDSEVWEAEAARRRTMAMQSIVLSLTENAESQRVQLYVADADDEIGQRLQLAWFDPTVTDPQIYLGACSRDERICLSAHNAMEAILMAWKQHDWATLSLFLNRKSGGILDEEAV